MFPVRRIVVIWNMPFHWHKSKLVVFRSVGWGICMNSFPHSKSMEIGSAIIASRPRKCRASHNDQLSSDPRALGRLAYSFAELRRSLQSFFLFPRCWPVTKKWQWERLCKGGEHFQVGNLFLSKLLDPNSLLFTELLDKITLQGLKQPSKHVPIRLHRTTYHLLTISTLASVCRKALAVLPVASTHPTKINIRRARSWRLHRAWVWHKSARWQQGALGMTEGNRNHFQYVLMFFFKNQPAVWSSDERNIIYECNPSCNTHPPGAV